MTPFWRPRLPKEMKFRKRDIRVMATKVKRSPTTLVGLIAVAAVLFVAAFGEYIAPYPEDYSAIHPEKTFLPPCPAHPLGTDELGRDVLSRVILGAKVSVVVGVSVVLLSVLIGTPVGLLAGYRGGRIEAVIMRVTDVFLSIPSIVLALAISAMLAPTLENAVLALTVGWWAWYSRLGYSLAVTLKNNDYILALKGMGASSWYIVFKEMLPNVVPILAVKATLDVGYAILAEAILGFLGFGVKPPTPEWGTMLSQARIHMPDKWWMVTFPGCAIFVTVMGFNLLGDGLRDVLDVTEL